MILNYTKYYETYHNAKGEFVDHWQKGLSVYPFTLNPSTSGFDRKCGLLGITGEFMRCWEGVDSTTIRDFKSDVAEPVSKYLSVEKLMPKPQVDEFLDVLRDILFVNGTLNITNTSLLKNLPLVPQDDNITKKEAAKYEDGEKKIARLLYSILNQDHVVPAAKQAPNLLSNILNEALSGGFANTTSSGSEDVPYFVPKFIEETFRENVQWLCKQEEAVVVKNLPLLLYFYICYIVTQALFFCNTRRKEPIDKPELLYFILAHEKTSQKSEAYVKGWNQKLPKVYTDKMVARKIALDIVNTALGGCIGYYHEVLKALEDTPFEDNKDVCERILNDFQEQKRITFERRKSESVMPEIVDTEVNSYEQFIEKLELLCITYQSQSYCSRLRKKVSDLLSIRFLQVRRGLHILTLDNEMLIFLIALFTQGKKTKLEDMYEVFHQYGIFFNLNTRTAIEELLLKLNLLDRKSDSGEAQYVTVVL